MMLLFLRKLLSGLRRVPRTKQSAGETKSTPRVLGKPTNTDKFHLRKTQAFTRLFVYWLLKFPRFQAIRIIANAG